MQISKRRINKLVDTRSVIPKTATFPVLPDSESAIYLKPQIIAILYAIADLVSSYCPKSTHSDVIAEPLSSYYPKPTRPDVIAEPLSSYYPKPTRPDVIAEPLSSYYPKPTLRDVIAESLSSYYPKPTLRDVIANLCPHNVGVVNSIQLINPKSHITESVQFGTITRFCASSHLIPITPHDLSHINIIEHLLVNRDGCFPVFVDNT